EAQQAEPTAPAKPGVPAQPAKSKEEVKQKEEKVEPQPQTEKASALPDFGAVGYLEAAQSVDLRAHVNGVLTKVLFHAGANVKQGEPLFELDSTQYQLAVDKASAEVDSAASQLTLAVANYERLQKLLQRGGVSEAEFAEVAAKRISAE